MSWFFLSRFLKTTYVYYNWGLFAVTMLNMGILSFLLFLIILKHKTPYMANTN